MRNSRNGKDSYEWWWSAMRSLEMKSWRLHLKSNISQHCLCWQRDGTFIRRCRKELKKIWKLLCATHFSRCSERLLRKVSLFSLRAWAILLLLDFWELNILSHKSGRDLFSSFSHNFSDRITFRCNSSGNMSVKLLVGSPSYRAKQNDRFPFGLRKPYRVYSTAIIDRTENFFKVKV